MKEILFNKIEVEYTDFDYERFVEDNPINKKRKPFIRDRARVLHSSSLRKLAAKTQVLALDSSDFPRTRLTHTLEVAQIGRELGEELGCNPDLVETACLTHDLGHPPFGHNGEEALHKVSLDIGGFEGNAQTFRLLTRLESKNISQGISRGLNLTRATLDASTKYPWNFDGINSKFGFYEEDREVFEWVRKNRTGQEKIFEAQIMDIADDIAYSVHDIEDAINAYLLDPSVLFTTAEVEEILRLTKADYATDLDVDVISEALPSLLNETWWVRKFEGNQNDLALLKNMTSHLIGKFTSEIENETKTYYSKNEFHREKAKLQVPIKTRAKIAVMKSIVKLFVLQRKGAAEHYALEQEILMEVVAGLEKNPNKLDPQFKEQYGVAKNDKDAKRAIIDQVASLTDASARRLAKEFVG